MDLVQEVKNINQFLESRFGLCADDGALARNMIDGLVTKIKTSSDFSSAHGISMYTQMQQCAFLQKHGHLQAIAAAVDDRLVSKGVEKTSSSFRRPQRLTNLRAYLTQKDVDVLLQKNVQLEEQKVVVMKRLFALGISSLHEQTVANAVGLLVCLLSKKNGSFPSYDSIYTMVQNFKGSFAAHKGDAKEMSLPVYPDNPDELPAALHKQAYSDDDPPVDLPLEGLEDIVAQHIPLRKTSKLLRTNQEMLQRLNVAPSAQSAPQLQDMLCRAMQQMLSGGQQPKLVQPSPAFVWTTPKPISNEVAGDVELSVPRSTSASSLSSEKLSSPEEQPRGWCASRIEALEAQRSQANEVPEVVPDSSAMQGCRLLSLEDLRPPAMCPPATDVSEKPAVVARISSEQYEQELLGKLLENKEKRENKKKAETQINKRPAAAHCDKKVKKSTQKKATSPIPDDKEEPKATYKVVWSPDFKGSRATFLSKHYHAAESAALRMGLSDVEAKALGRKAWAAAAGVWTRNVA